MPWGKVGECGHGCVCARPRAAWGGVGGAAAAGVAGSQGGRFPDGPYYLLYIITYFSHCSFSVLSMYDLYDINALLWGVKGWGDGRGSEWPEEPGLHPIGLRGALGAPSSVRPRTQVPLPALGDSLSPYTLHAQPTLGGLTGGPQPLALLSEDPHDSSLPGCRFGTFPHFFFCNSVKLVPAAKLK